MGLGALDRFLVLQVIDDLPHGPFECQWIQRGVTCQSRPNGEEELQKASLVYPSGLDHGRDVIKVAIESAFESSLAPVSRGRCERTDRVFTGDELAAGLPVWKGGDEAVGRSQLNVEIQALFRIG